MAITGTNEPLQAFGTAQSENALYVASFLLKRGWTLNAICGLLGNMMEESHINPGTWFNFETPSSDQRAFGLIQWYPASKFFKWHNLNWIDYKNGIPSSKVDWMMELQCKTIAGEIEGAEISYWMPGANKSQKDGKYFPGKMLETYKEQLHAYATSTETPEFLAAAWLCCAERPGNESSHFQKRGEQARKWWNHFKDNFKDNAEIQNAVSTAVGGGIPFKSRAKSKTDYIRPHCIKDRVYPRGDGCDGTYWAASGTNPYTGSSENGTAIPNCTAYAYGRFWEIMDNYRNPQKTLDELEPISTAPLCTAGGGLPMDDAGGWYTQVENWKNNNYKEFQNNEWISDIGWEPRLGAVICWGKDGSYGHVGIVENVIDQHHIITSESGNRQWDSPWWVSDRVSDENGDFSYGGYKFQGFIYPKATFGSGAIPGISTIKQLSPFKIQISGDTETIGATKCDLYVKFSDFDVSRKVGEHDKFSCSFQTDNGLNEFISKKENDKNIYEIGMSDFVSVSGLFSVIIDRPIQHITSSCISAVLYTTEKKDKESESVKENKVEKPSEDDPNKGTVVKLQLLESVPCVYMNYNGMWRQSIPYVYTKLGNKNSDNPSWKMALPSIYSSVYRVLVYFSCEPPDDDTETKSEYPGIYSTVTVSQKLESKYLVEVVATSETIAKKSAESVVKQMYGHNKNFNIIWIEIDVNDLDKKKSNKKWRYVLDNKGRIYDYPSVTATVSGIDINVWNLILVNPSHSVDENEVNEFGKKCNSTSNGNKVDDRIVNDLNNLLNAASSYGLYVCSGYRTYATQKGLFDNKVVRCNGDENLAAIEVARPGTSEHHTGLAVDFCSSSVSILESKYWKDSDVYNWLLKNCANYGFILRYPRRADKNDSSPHEETQIIWEPWHYRYVGKEHAKTIMEKCNANYDNGGYTLEEYLQDVQLNPSNYMSSIGSGSVGIDVSYAQGTIDWSEVKSSGKVSFAILRCGYGTSGIDSTFNKNMNGCKSNGIPWGVYYYSYATSSDGAKKEAQNCLSILNNEVPPLGIWYDIEDPSQSGLSNSTLVQIAKSFCSEIKSINKYSNTQTGIYSMLSWFEDKFQSLNDGSTKYPIWVAWWPSSVTNAVMDVGKLTNYVSIWQYAAEKGNTLGRNSGDTAIPGITSQYIDRNKTM